MAPGTQAPLPNSLSLADIANQSRMAILNWNGQERTDILDMIGVGW